MKGFLQLPRLNARLLKQRSQGLIRWIDRTHEVKHQVTPLDNRNPSRPDNSINSSQALGRSHNRNHNIVSVGPSKAYLCGHDEVHSLAKNMDGADVRFWMGFGDHYINVFTVLKSIGLLSEQPVKLADGSEVVPLKVVKACLPDPSSLAPEYEGKTCIGDFVKGTPASLAASISSGV